MLTPYVHDGIEGSKGCHTHELGMDLCRVKVTLEQKYYNFLLLVTREISVRSEGKILATEVNIPPQALHFIDLLLNISNLVILNPLITIGCQNGVVALDLESFLHFFPDQNLPPSKWVSSVV